MRNWQTIHYALNKVSNEQFPYSIGNDFRCHRDLLAVGGKYNYEPVRRLNKLGEWISIEVKNKDGKITASIFGEQALAGEHKYTEPGYIIFQSQGTALHWRNIRIKEE